uniref:Uncharacterized protein n=1 Tax=viral metagenome TaxID=1070528 RepID=A0A6C0AZH4_9ZZZZ
MDSLDESKLSSKLGFFKYMFNFDDTTKAELLNITQYAMIAIIPIVILNKLMQRFVPEAQEEKGSFELLAEVIIQIVVMFIGLFYIHRITVYIPTYSGTKYPEYSVTFIILAVLIIITSLQTKLGEKISILFERVSELWEGKSADDKKKKNKGKGNVKVSQPISGQSQNQMPSNASAMANSLYSQGSTSISSLPTEPVQQNAPDYNAMYRNDATPMPGAATPGDPYGGMIMAANEVLGGSAFGANW